MQLAGIDQITCDEDPADLGEALRLPPQQHLRAHLEHSLTPLVNPRAASRA
jgi:hypothetical protein